MGPRHSMEMSQLIEKVLSTPFADRKRLRTPDRGDENPQRLLQHTRTGEMSAADLKKRKKMEQAAERCSNDDSDAPMEGKGRTREQRNEAERHRIHKMTSTLDGIKAELSVQGVVPVAQLMSKQQILDAALKQLKQLREDIIGLEQTVGELTQRQLNCNYYSSLLQN